MDLVQLGMKEAQDGEDPATSAAGNSVSTLMSVLTEGPTVLEAGSVLIPRVRSHACHAAAGST